MEKGHHDGDICLICILIRSVSCYHEELVTMIAVPPLKSNGPNSFAHTLGWGQGMYIIGVSFSLIFGKIGRV